MDNIVCNRSTSPEAIFLNPVIVHEILKNYDAEELHSKQEVCTLWKGIVDNILRKQANLLFFSHHFYNGSEFEKQLTNAVVNRPALQQSQRDDMVHENSSPRNDNSGNSASHLDESSQHGTFPESSSTLKRRSSPSDSNDHQNAKKRKLGPDNFLDSFLKWKLTWKYNPALILISYQVPSDTGFNSVQNNCWRTRSEQFKRIHSVLTKHLPPNCKLVFNKGLTRQLSMLNLIHRDGFTVSDSITMEYVLADSLLFPSIRPLDILSVPTSQLTSTEVKDTVDELLNKMVLFLQSKTDVKLFMFFLDTYCFGGQLSLSGYQELLGKLHVKLEECLSQHKDMVVICSTTKDPVMYTQMSASKNADYLHEYGSFFALCFSGPSVSASSVYLNDSIKTREQVTDKLKILKDAVERSDTELPKRNDSVLAIKTSGYLRMCNVYSIFTEDDNDGDPEEAVFRDVFPDMKLITFNGIGALGGDFNVGEKCFDSFSTGSGTSSLIRPEMNSSVFSIIRFYT